mgnify:CR=1 FL=1
MARILTAKSLRELRDATPRPAMWPVCGECGTEFILRRSLVVRGGNLAKMAVEWAWVRDCKHKRTGMTDRVEREKGKRK